MAASHYLRGLSILPFALGFFLLGCRTISPNSGSPTIPGDEVTATSREPNAQDSRVTTYALQQGDIHATLTVSHHKDTSFQSALQFEVTRGGKSTSCSSDLPADARFTSFQTLFRHLLAAEKPEQSYVLYIPCYHEVDDRLPGLAAASPLWHAIERSKPSVKQQYDAIAKLLNDENAMSELSKALDPFHYHVVIEAGDLETIWTRVSDLTTEQRRLITVPVKQNEVLPSAIGKTFQISRGTN